MNVQLTISVQSAGEEASVSRHAIATPGSVQVACTVDGATDTTIVVLQLTNKGLDARIVEVSAVEEDGDRSDSGDGVEG